jgi:hypothetical protein
MDCTRPHLLALALPLLALVALGCNPVPPEVVDDTESTSADPTSADPSGATETLGTTTDPDGTGTTDTSETGPMPSCGNGTVDADAGEDCDDAALAGATCESLGFAGGTLACDASCAYDTGGCAELPAAPVLSLAFSAVKQFDFSWAAVPGADSYQLLESTAPGEPFAPLGGAIVGTALSQPMPLHFRHGASYQLQACNPAGCTDSAPVSVMSSLVEAIGYFKASNPALGDDLGFALALSGDGNTLAVGAPSEASAATGIDGNQADDSAYDAGAVYVFVRDPLTNAWTQQAYVKASNTDAGDAFGWSVALSADGSTLAVGAVGEDGSAPGIGGNQADNLTYGAGAVYVLVRNGAGAWSQQAYVKAHVPGVDDSFGADVALSSDGNTLAVGAYGEDGSASGIDGLVDDSAYHAGAAYVFVRSGAGVWSQQAYIKASNPDINDEFGRAVALASDGNTLAVGAIGEASNATGIGGNQADDSLYNAGAVYVLVRSDAGVWSQQAYVKASNTGGGDRFGQGVALSGDGHTLAVGAPFESSGATGIGGNQADDGAYAAGAVYVLVRSAGVWSQQAYVKASNGEAGDGFGTSVALSADGSVLAVGADDEDGNTTGLAGNRDDDAAYAAGAAYVLVRDGLGAWSQRAYVKASNTGALDAFGARVALASDAGTLAVAAPGESSSASGIGGDAANDAAYAAGAVYLY